MKIANAPLIVLSLLFVASGCIGKSSQKKEAVVEQDTVTVPDTGYTGIKQYFSNQIHFKDVTFKNGVRQGETRSYYQGGQLRQTFWYENGLREDSSRWFYLEGQVFRTTPYKHDTIDGTVKQYYRNGKLRAKLEYKKGLRVPTLEEFTQQGKLLKDYPEITYTFTDNYKSAGKVRINLELSDKSTKVKFYSGEFTSGLFDTARCEIIKTLKGKAFIDLRKTGKPQSSDIGIIASVVTNLGNNYLTYKKINLPYNDLR